MGSQDAYGRLAMVQCVWQIGMTSREACPTGLALRVDEVFGRVFEFGVLVEED